MLRSKGLSGVKTEADSVVVLVAEVDAWKG